MKGLTNLGNTCYFNATLQCLLQIPALSNHMILNEYFGDCEFTKIYRKLTREFWMKSNKNQIIDTNEIMKIFRKKYKNFDNSDEHDAQECLLAILEILEKSKEKLIKNTFYSKINKKVIYPGGTSDSHEDSMCIMFHPKKDCNLLQLIEEFKKEEIIEGYIDNTNTRHHCAAIKNTIAKMPPVVIFCFNMFIQKFYIDIPEKLGNYKLIAVCLHQGTMGGGHYVALTKHKNKWYLKDDEGVRELSDNNNFNKMHCYFCIFKNSLS